MADNKFLIWKDSTGKFEIEASLVSVENQLVLLLRKDKKEVIDSLHVGPPAPLHDDLHLANPLRNAGYLIPAQDSATRRPPRGIGLTVGRALPSSNESDGCRPTDHLPRVRKGTARRADAIRNELRRSDPRVPQVKVPLPDPLAESAAIGPTTGHALEPTLTRPPTHPLTRYQVRDWLARVHSDLRRPPTPTPAPS